AALAPASQLRRARKAVVPNLVPTLLDVVARPPLQDGKQEAARNRPDRGFPPTRTTRRHRSTSGSIARFYRRTNAPPRHRSLIRNLTYAAAPPNPRTCPRTRPRSAHAPRNSIQRAAVALCWKGDMGAPPSVT